MYTKQFLRFSKKDRKPNDQRKNRRKPQECIFVTVVKIQLTAHKRRGNNDQSLFKCKSRTGTRQVSQRRHWVSDQWNWPQSTGHREIVHTKRQQRRKWRCLKVQKWRNIMHGSRAKRILTYHELNETSTSFVGSFVRKEDEGLFTLTSKEMPHLKNT